MRKLIWPVQCLPRLVDQFNEMPFKGVPQPRAQRWKIDSHCTIIRLHHSICDAISISTQLCNLSDHFLSIFINLSFTRVHLSIDILHHSYAYCEEDAYYFVITLQSSLQTCPHSGLASQYKRMNIRLTVRSLSLTLHLFFLSASSSHSQMNKLNGAFILTRHLTRIHHMLSRKPCTVTVVCK